MDRNDFEVPFEDSDEVALLAEGVDRNILQSEPGTSLRASPSSRRAWIEIEGTDRSAGQARVALLAEGVDRNKEAAAAVGYSSGRPPRGGRG